MQAEANAKVYDHEERFKGLTDEEIAGIAQEGHDSQAAEYLVNKYRNFVKAKARSYFLVGADRDDIIQEGMIGLYKATRDFRGDKLSSFRAFAELCITRQIITAIKTATRQKHIPLNSYVSLNKPIYEEESDRTLQDILAGIRVTDPEELVISREEFMDIELKMNEILSDLEWKVLTAYLDGKSYNEMSQELHRHVKSIDNALQRVKRKLERYLETRDGETKRKKAIDRNGK
ncbi:RNA polymerase factor sigma-70 [Megasphaera cerevisiae DSM 20462]|jgi:RNA polymerase sporulation-specific sigma factor|uniref:RNA polymerase sigma factor SigS n=1 Tax=Megasphaera cerevisiae DSM 20462 TaxID=1122219 RepID=A0A0J6WU96_9FIRM|nr:RNA polymerase sporulation sigma factor SigH [Megasphaera cerevisiae]KMO87100.1 RNA polymerase factor sigma-70 [Megasphaera cerevisiae DSM 20462]MCI1751150.1 RNA polymerase sporulation sigma factor SigH [Megasphaera cerevisiae]OKY52833.1 RNA polymerase factor sigma-70 [Megasphaera cerevisiae]SJZ45490.1 RNA polymerase, sigma 30 subunit, SigH [Megasphaera cerevisiae DSM 20462]